VATTTTAVTTTTAASGQTNAVDDLAGAKDDKSVSIHVLQNDTFGGSSADNSTLAVVTDPLHGSATVSGADIVYRSDHNYRGLDFFTYSICSLSGSCDQATVYVVVTH
jgi:hypothetical protein